MPDSYRGRKFDEARVKVLPGQYAEMLVQQLAPLKVSVKEVTDDIVCLGDCF